MGLVRGHDDQSKEEFYLPPDHRPRLLQEMELVVFLRQELGQVRPNRSAGVRQLATDRAAQLGLQSEEKVQQDQRDP